MALHHCPSGKDRTKGNSELQSSCSPPSLPTPPTVVVPWSIDPQLPVHMHIKRIITNPLLVGWWHVVEFSRPNIGCDHKLDAMKPNSVNVAVCGTTTICGRIDGSLEQLLAPNDHFGMGLVKQNQLVLSSVKISFQCWDHSISTIQHESLLR